MGKDTYAFSINPYAPRGMNLFIRYNSKIGYMSYIYLIGAIIFEVFGTTCMKLSDGFSNILPSVGIFLFYGISFAMFTIALKGIEVSIAYAIWAGMGTAMITAIGIFWFKEPATAVKMISIVFVVIGVVGLNISGGGH